MISGRSMSIPNWPQTKAASSGEKAMFFGDSGSIAGGMTVIPGLLFIPAGTYCSMCQTEASYSDISGISLSIGSGLGSERSM